MRNWRAGAGCYRSARGDLQRASPTLVTGLPPSGHGAVANGWCFRNLAEVLLWRQPNQRVQGVKIWDVGKRRDPDFGPLVISSEADCLPEGAIDATDFKALVLDHVFS